MAEFPGAPFQQALIQALRAAARVTALVGGRVFDEPPQQGQLPFLRIGNVDWYPLRTDGCDGWRVLYQIEGHSRPAAGRVEATRLAEAVIDALDRAESAFAIPGFTVAWNELQTMTVDRGVDGKTYLASVTFEAALDDTP